MRYIKLFESFKTEEEIHRICSDYDIENYTINSDGSIDVDGSVCLSNNFSKKLPLVFNKVTGDFLCDSNKLTSLEGAPKMVGGCFDCSYNELTSLEFAPIEVGGWFRCHNNKLTSLIGSPIKINDDYFCSFNSLDNLIGSPEKIGGDFYCNQSNLNSLEGSPKVVDGEYIMWGNNLMTLKYLPDLDFESFNLGDNPVKKIWDLFKNKPDNFLELFNFYEPIKLIDGEWAIILEVLNQVLYETGNDEFPINQKIKNYKVL